MSGLRAAAVALIDVVPETVVRTILKMLVAAIEPESARAPEAPSPSAPPRSALSPPPRPVLSPPKRRPATAAPQGVLDPEWDELRRRVRAAMTERGADYSAVALAIGRSAVAVRINISSRKPPPAGVRTKLQTWLDQAPAVAAPIPFPGSGTEHRGGGNGSAYSSAA